MILKIVRAHWSCIKLQVLKLTIRAMTVKTTAEKRIHNLEKEKNIRVSREDGKLRQSSILKRYG